MLRKEDRGSYQWCEINFGTSYRKDAWWCNLREDGSA